MTGKFESFANEFAGEVKPKLPWCQIINAPDLTQQQMKTIKPPHGLFITQENANLAGISDDAFKAIGFEPYQHEFRGGEETATGWISYNVRFVVLHRTPTVIENDNRIVGYLFDNNGTLSEIGKVAKDDPLSFRKRSWWLIALLDKDNNLVTQTPVKLSLSGATGASMSQELVKNMAETEAAFFKAIGKPTQMLSDKAKSFFIYDWTFAPFKSKGKAPFEVVAERIGGVAEVQTPKRYSGEGYHRTVTIKPADLNQLIILPSSQLGKVISEQRATFKELFFQRITYYENSLNAPEVEETETETVIPEVTVDTSSIPDDIVF